MPPARLYHHQARLEEPGHITIAEYRPQARQSGERRDISLTTTGLRLSDADRAELLAAFERLIREAKAKESPDGTWTRIAWTLVDAQDRTPQP